MDAPVPVGYFFKCNLVRIDTQLHNTFGGWGGKCVSRAAKPIHTLTRKVLPLHKKAPTEAEATQHAYRIT